MVDFRILRHADLIVKEIVKDISDRRGLKHEWEAIDEDIQNEIKSKWRQIIYKELTKDAPTT